MRLRIVKRLLQLHQVALWHLAMCAVKLRAERARLEGDTDTVLYWHAHERHERARLARKSRVLAMRLSNARIRRARKW